MKYMYVGFALISFMLAGVVSASCAGELDGCEEEFHQVHEYAPMSTDIKLLGKMIVLIENLDRTQSVRIRDILEKARPRFAPNTRQSRFIKKLLAHKNISYLSNLALSGDFFDGIDVIDNYYTFLSKGDFSKAYALRMSGVEYETYVNRYSGVEDVYRKIMKRNADGDYELNVRLRESNLRMSDEYYVVLRIVDGKIQTISSRQIQSGDTYMKMRDEVEKYTGLNPGIVDIYGKTDDNRYYYACISSGLVQSQVLVYDLLLNKIKYEILEEVTGQGIRTCFPYDAKNNSLRYLIDGNPHLLRVN